MVVEIPTDTANTTAKEKLSIRMGLSNILRNTPATPFLKMINIHYKDCINKDTLKLEKIKVNPPSIQYYGIIHKDRSDYYVVMEDSVIHTLKANSITPNGVQIIKGDTTSIQYKKNSHQYSKKIEK